MYAFRFNPVFKQWVLVGGSNLTPHRIDPAHLLDVGRQPALMAATHPRQPFIIDPPSRKSGTEHTALQDEPPVGEYELFLYNGEVDFFAWTARQWDAWFQLLQHRIVQTHHNPYIHYLHCTLHTVALSSIEEYQRVGDLIATSHPLLGFLPLLTTEQITKIRQKESISLLVSDEKGALYVPLAPLHTNECWYFPAQAKAGIEQMSKEERFAVAERMAALVGGLHEAFPHQSFVINISTSIQGMAQDVSWWIQVYSDIPESTPLPIRPLPEGLIQRLRLLLGV